MFMASNQFKIPAGHEGRFEKVRVAQHARLRFAPGFISFRFHKGPQKEGHTLYFRVTVWEAEDDFLAWRIAEQIRENVERVKDGAWGWGNPSPSEEPEPQFARSTRH